ncbi:hypothetical protein CPLU01_09968 [Colletotrichum plurivorum]|uniref:Uncharacterized protein n=1 Tax=Colletotrichum plurivorum TaxID=2175906 RepID=A0A8H6NB12_9PEZI|nr:hypothetical protein CPLU01_09968 [Colletotrichum plurivorum]
MVTELTLTTNLSRILLIRRFCRALAAGNVSRSLTGRLRPRGIVDATKNSDAGQSHLLKSDTLPASKKRGIGGVADTDVEPQPTPRRSHQKMPDVESTPMQGYNDYAPRLSPAVRGHPRPVCVGDSAPIRGKIAKPAPISVNNTISKDCTGGEGVCKAQLLAAFGERLRSSRARDVSALRRLVKHPDAKATGTQKADARKTKTGGAASSIFHEMQRLCQEKQQELDDLAKQFMPPADSWKNFNYDLPSFDDAAITHPGFH